MDWLIDAAIAIGAAIFADTVVEEVTGKHIHEHVIAWWNEIRDIIIAWAQEHEHLDVVEYMVKIDSVVQGVANLAYRAKTRRGRVMTIETQEVDHAEALELFPELAESDQVDITPMVMAA